LNPRVKEKVKREIDKMLDVGIIFSFDEANCISPIVIQNEKDVTKIRVCVEYRSMNNACVHDLFPTPLSDEVLDNVVGNEAYSFIDGFSGYHQVIAKEDKRKTTFTMEWGSYTYNVMPFGLKNAPVVFSRIVIVAFRDYIHKFLEVYMDDWTVYNLLKKHTSLLRVMFEICRQLQISLNLKKCIFTVPFGTLIGHIVFKDGVCVDPAKITSIIHMEPPLNIKQLRATLGYTGYYKRFIRNYATITAPMERLLKKTEEFIWTTNCQAVLDKQKERLVSAPILVYLDWNKMFHVHIDSSGIALEAVLAQPREKMDHSVYYASRKLSMAENNYTTIE